MMETATRDARGRFKPGCSGNPAGKPPGALNHATRLARWLAEADEEAAAKALIARAKEGNVAALRILFDRIDPKPRGRAIALDLPADATLAQKFDATFAAMAAGAITPEDALLVSRCLDHHSKAIEWVEDDEAEDAAPPARPLAFAPATREYEAALRKAYAEGTLAGGMAKAPAASPAVSEAEETTPDAPTPPEPSAASQEPSPPSPLPSPRRGEGESVEAAESPRRDYARPWPEGAEPDQHLNPTSISRGWSGKSRYGQRAKPPVRDGVPVERPPRRRRPRPGGTWMGV
jgi:hypothetical protein